MLPDKKIITCNTAIETSQYSSEVWVSNKMKLKLDQRDG